MNVFRWSQGTNGLVAFDLETFLNMAQRSRKWQCPHSMRHSRVQELQVDTYITQILERLKVALVLQLVPYTLSVHGDGIM